MTDYTLPPLPAGAMPPSDVHTGNWAAYCSTAREPLTDDARTTAEGIVLTVGQTKGWLIYYTFEPAFHSRRFYHAYFNLDEHGSFPIFTSELVRDPETGKSSVVESEIGTAQIYFTWGLHGVFVMDTIETHVLGFHLGAMQLSQDPRCGPYVVNEESKNGYMINFFDEGLVTVHSFWHHPSDEPWPGMYPDGNHTQEWEAGVAVPAGADTWTVYLRRTINSQRDNPMPVLNEHVKTLTLKATAEGFNMIGPGGTEALRQIGVA